jgi:ABC-type uncharacterized transport system ATPase subunit
MENRRQLQWNLPAWDSFKLQRAVYGLERSVFKKKRAMNSSNFIPAHTHKLSLLK